VTASAIGRVAPAAVLLLLLLCPTSGTAETTPHEFSLIHTGPGLSLHKEMYILPYTYAEQYTGRNTEIVFQLSAKHRLFGTRFYVAYSQISFWQAYDYKDSAPFRETNYNPELFYRFKESKWGKGTIGADAGFEHESNGQRVPESRSWNLLYFSPHYHGDRWLAYVKLRYRIPEEEKTDPTSPEGDDNPDITDYLGWTDIQLYYVFGNEHMVHVEVRGYIGTDKGSLGLVYSIPIPKSEGSYFMAQITNGYGDSLVDYNEHITRFGLGFMFNR